MIPRLFLFLWSFLSACLFCFLLVSFSNFPLTDFDRFLTHGSSFPHSVTHSPVLHCVCCITCIVSLVSRARTAQPGESCWIKYIRDTLSSCIVIGIQFEQLVTRDPYDTFIGIS